MALVAAWVDMRVNPGTQRESHRAPRANRCVFFKMFSFDVSFPVKHREEKEDLKHTPPPRRETQPVPRGVFGCAGEAPLVMQNTSVEGWVDSHVRIGVRGHLEQKRHSARRGGDSSTATDLTGRTRLPSVVPDLFIS